VHDVSRMGALRFRERGSQEFQSADPAMAAPPWASLRDLEYASSLVEADTDDDELDPWLSILVAPGSSLGGSRPKAGVTDPSGDPWIAKFPARGDDRDTGAWELLAAELARDAGVEMSACRRESFSARGSTFMTRRFDRHGTARIHFASAMTLLGRVDGDDASAGASYLALAELITRQGSRPADDLRQLWRRIVFSVAIANSDDHLRNHGFLLDGKGWHLSPAYDVNPTPGARSLSLAIDENDPSLDFGLALSVARHFRVAAAEAEAIVAETRAVVATWRERAQQMGLPRSEVELMESAFRAR
jgi:serine/threonine-protein kinase HipA